MAGLTLSLQTGTLYASGEASTFTGTGGPWGFSPFTGEFGGVVSSAGLAAEPFEDVVYGVAPGDEVIFVVALQNLSAGQRAFDVGLRAALPAGFAVPADGADVTVTDGAGTDLAFSGDLFGSGIRLGAPVAGYAADGGLNLVLVTYSLVAGSALPGPLASIASSASITHSALTAGGADQGIGFSAGTLVVSAAPTPVVQARSSPAAVAKGQSITFDVSVAIPAGTMRDVRLDAVLPAGSASLRLLSNTLSAVGSGLTLSTPVFGADGSVFFSSIGSTGTSAGDPAANTLSFSLVVQADGDASGTAVLQTVLSSAASGTGAARWSATVGSSVGVVVPPPPPVISGVLPPLASVPGVAVHPLRELVLGDSAPSATATLAVTLRDGSLGRLSGVGAALLNAAGSTFVMSGTLAALQAAARQLLYTGTGAGTQLFTVTLVDPNGSVAQDAASRVTVAGVAGSALPVASGASLSVGELSGTVALRGVGSTLEADRVAGVPSVSGFGTGDRLVLPGASAALSWVAGAGYGLLTVGGATTLRLEGSYELSSFTAAPGAAGTVVVGFRDDPLFDAAFYLARNPDVAANGVDPWQHYLFSGWKENRAPGPLFDAGYYLLRNPDVAAARVNPLLHFEFSGWKEGRSASASFSTADYLAAYPDVARAGVNPLLHYAVSGMAEGRRAFPVAMRAADPLLDPKYYYATNPDVRNAGINASDHYVAAGGREGRNPNAWFDSRYYLTQNPDVARAGVNPLLHYEGSGWKEGRQPSLVFDTGRYLDADPALRSRGVDPLLSFLTVGRDAGQRAFPTGGTARADPLVDAAFFDAQLGATLLPDGLAAAQQAAWSYDSTGWRAGLNPSRWFDTTFYLSRNPDVARAGVNPLTHYEVSGWQEGRSPSAAFGVQRYLAAYPDVARARVDPLLHYVVSGQAEGRAAFPA